MTTKPLIYIAGPYTNPDPVENTRKAIDAGMWVYETTSAPVIIPHLTMLTHLVHPRGLEFWYDFDLRQMEHCSAVLRLVGRSSGADKEVEVASLLGLPVFRVREDRPRSYLLAKSDSGQTLNGFINDWSDT